MFELLGGEAAGFVQERAERAPGFAGDGGRRRGVHVAAPGHETVQPPALAIGVPMQKGAVLRRQDFRQPAGPCGVQAREVMGDAFGMGEHRTVDSLQQVVAAVSREQAIAVVDVAGAVAIDPAGRGDIEGPGGPGGGVARCGVYCAARRVAALFAAL